MGIGAGILLIAIGAIMRFAVTVHTNGFNIHTIGDILMGVGALGILISLIFWSSWHNRGSVTEVHEHRID